MAIILVLSVTNLIFSGNLIWQIMDIELSIFQRENNPIRVFSNHAIYFTSVILALNIVIFLLIILLTASRFSKLKANRYFGALPRVTSLKKQNLVTYIAEYTQESSIINTTFVASWCLTIFLELISMYLIHIYLSPALATYNRVLANSIIANGLFNLWLQYNFSSISIRIARLVRK